jgi:hypothetical protein
MINLTAHLNLIKFSEIANGLPREDAERVATAFPDMFKDAIEFGPAKEPTPKGEPAGPRVAKVRPAKSEAPIDKGHVREVAKHWLSRRHPANGSQYRIFELECGHTATRKPSQGIPWKMRCRECGEVST